MDVVFLSRLQFALTIMFHYLFPPLTIGMAVVMVFLEGRFLKTRDPIYEQATRFWTGIFALNFAVGVATGIVMEFEFGTNWAAYSRFVGDVFGSALAAEGIFAFFLESGFLALLVFGWDRVGPRMHFFSTLMVSVGSIFSSIWIVVANSWQQTPAGHHIVQVERDGAPWFVNGQPVLRAEITSFWALVWNPSTLHRLVHVWIGAFIMGSFFIMSVSAWYLLKRRHDAFARRSFEGALLLGTICSLASAVSGHFQGQNVYRYQPAKLAAFEALYRTAPAPLTAFGIPDPAHQRVKFEIGLPGGTSFLVKGDFSEPLIGLDQFRPGDRPPVFVPFVSYHIMAMLGMCFIGITLLAVFYRWRGTLYDQRWLLWIFVASILGAVAANELGWAAAEVGRQPWVVEPPIVRDANGDPVRGPDGFIRYETISIPMPDGSVYEQPAGLRTQQGVSEAVSASEVLTSILMFGLIYALLGAVWVFVLNHKIQAGPPELAAHGVQGFRHAITGRPTHEQSLTEAKDA
jgi:cytochrome bd ubiquinol oxidase subunit I